MPKIKDVAKIRSFESQKAGMRQAVSAISAALDSPDRQVRNLARVGITFTRWQMFLVWILSIRLAWTQKYMFWLIRNEFKKESE